MQTVLTLPQICTHINTVMAKPRKVGEPAGTYAAKPPAKRAPAAPTTPTHQVRDLDDATAQKLADKIFSERKDLLRKLAQ
jgi:hypothetical protein